MADLWQEYKWRHPETAANLIGRNLFVASLLSRELHSQAPQGLQCIMQLFYDRNHTVVGTRPGSTYNEEDERSMDGIFTRLVLHDRHQLQPEDLLLVPPPTISSTHRAN